MHLSGTQALNGNCAAAVWGTTLQQSLRSYGCTQVIRATYTSANEKYIGELAVFNLSDEASADALLGDLDPANGAQGFFLPLTQGASIAKFPGGGFAESQAQGHFVVVGWASPTAGRYQGDPDVNAAGANILTAGSKFYILRENKG